MILLYSSEHKDDSVRLACRNTLVLLDDGVFNTPATTSAYARFIKPQEYSRGHSNPPHIAFDILCFALLYFRVLRRDHEPL